MDTETGVTWNHEGTKLALYPQNKRGLLYVLSAQTGDLLDSIRVSSAFYSFFDWMKPNIFASQQSDGSIITYNMLDKSQSLMVGGQGSPYGFSGWLDFQKMVFATKTGLFITHLETGQIKKIRLQTIKRRKDAKKVGEWK